ncbi:MAG: cell division protein ZapA [Lachnospiraceae bacterium]|nr:cell division protein ZapA [Lachnospiraceae bacterium]
MSNYSDKKDSDVTIAGKVYTLTGYESEEYLQRVAAYINSRISEYQRSDGFRRLPVETQNVLMLLNIADDYFKAKEELDQLLSDLEKRDKEAYDLKHNLVVQMTKMEALEKTFKELQEENSRNQRKVIELEAELRGRDRQAFTNSRRK